MENQTQKQQIGFSGVRIQYFHYRKKKKIAMTRERQRGIHISTCI